MDRVTFATASGLPWVALGVHFAAGLLAIVAGTTALSAAKGGTLHKRSGMAFTWAMLILGLTAAGIGLYERAPGQLIAGLVVTYLVVTAVTAVKPLPVVGHTLDVALMFLAFGGAAMLLYGGSREWVDAAVPVVGRPRVVPPLIAGTVILLAAIGDLRALRTRGRRGSLRLARHLWRMCFAMFIATGSFFIGQMQFVPEPVRKLPLLLGLGFAPLACLVYWMWRVRVRGRLNGILMGASDSRRAAVRPLP